MNGGSLKNLHTIVVIEIFLEIFLDCLGVKKEVVNSWAHSEIDGF